jgi:ribosomal protein L32
MKKPANFRERVIRSLTEKKANPVCPSCGHNNWAVIEEIVSITVAASDGGYRVPPPFVPAAGVICNNCGHIRFHSLAALGIGLEEEQPPPEAKP